MIGRNVDPWLPATASSRAVARLQSEVQMLLHTHPVNDAREARGPGPGQLVLAQRLRHAQADATRSAPLVDDRLRAPRWREDWAAWADAWHALDAGPIAALLRRSRRAPRSRCAASGARCRFERAQRVALATPARGLAAAAAHQLLDGL